MLSVPVVDALRSAVDRLLVEDLGALSRDEFVELLSGVEVQRRRLDAVDVRLLAEAQERRLAGDLGRASVQDVLGQSLRVNPAEAKARVGRAVELGPRRNVVGQVLPQLLPHCAAALTSGEVSAGHVQVISATLDRVPAGTDPAVFEVAEQYLVECARHVHPSGLRPYVAQLLARLDPDGVEPVEDRAVRRRELRLHTFADGSGALRGRLTPEAVELLKVVMDSLAAPRASRPETGTDAGTDAEAGQGDPVDAAGSDDSRPAGARDGGPHDGGARDGGPHDGGLRDEGSQGQRWHDGLVELLARVLRSGSLPAAGGVPAMLILTGSPDDVRAGTGSVSTSHGNRLSMRTALRLVGDGGAVAGIRIDTAGAVLAMGRDQRLATRPQRIALTVRDGGCCFPGCDRPAAWTEVHHVLAWQDGGPTDVDNMCLVCRFHHAHFEQMGWQVRMFGGVPEWLALAWLDPSRRWQRNRTHHPPDLDFQHPDAA